MRSVFSDMLATKKVFVMLFIGFLLALLPLLIAFSTQIYYNQHFYESKNGYFKYYTGLTLTKLQGLDVENFYDAAQAAFKTSSVLTDNMIENDLEKDHIMIFGMLTENGWTPPLKEGTKIDLASADEVVTSSDITDKPDAVKLFGKTYQVTGVAGNEYGTAYHFKAFFSFRGLPKPAWSTVQKEDVLQLVVRSNQNSQLEIADFLKKLKQAGGNVQASSADLTPVYQEELKSLEGVTQVVRLPYRLALIAMINCLIVSYYWIDTKRKDISLRKVLGAGNARIFFYIFGQLVLCALFAGAVAMSIQWLLTSAAKTILERTSYKIDFGLELLGMGILILILVSLLISIVPFIKTLRMQPAKALKE